MENLIAVARELNKSGDYEKAISTLMLIQQKDRYYFYELAKSLLQKKEYKEALENINKVIILKQDWLGAYTIKADILWKIQRVDLALQTYLDMIKNGASAPDFEKLAVNIIDSILDKNHEKSIAITSCIITYIETLHGRSTLTKFYAAIIDWSEGFYESACQKFNHIKAAELSKLDRHASGCLSMRYGNSLNKILNTSELNELDISTPPNYRPTEFNNIIFAACDADYFEKFSNLFISSVIKNSPNSFCHIHIANPTEETNRIINYFYKKYPDSGIHFSLQSNAPNNKTYYACLRFLCLELILKFYTGKMVFVCDIDAAFVGNLDELIFKKSNFNTPDFTIKKVVNAKKIHYPWRKIAAGFILLKNSHESIAFIKKIRTYIQFILNNTDSSNTWYLDQSVLACLIAMEEQNENSSLKISYSYGETSKIIRYPDASFETKEEFSLKYHKI